MLYQMAHAEYCLAVDAELAGLRLAAAERLREAHESLGIQSLKLESARDAQQAANKIVSAMPKQCIAGTHTPDPSWTAEKAAALTAATANADQADRQYQAIHSAKLETENLIRIGTAALARAIEVEAAWKREKLATDAAHARRSEVSRSLGETIADAIRAHAELTTNVISRALQHCEPSSA